MEILKTILQHLMESSNQVIQQHMVVGLQEKQIRNELQHLI